MITRLEYRSDPASMTLTRPCNALAEEEFLQPKFTQTELYA